MNTFKDTTGQAWTVDINYGSIERVLDQMDFQVLSLLDPQISVPFDSIKLLRVLFLLCKPQADALKIGYEQFRGAMNPDSLEAGADALKSGLISFSPSRLQPSLAKIQNAGTALQAAALQMANQMLDATTPEQIMEMIRSRESTGKVSTSVDTSTPVSSESTPALSRSEN